MLERILVPLDGSSTAERILEHLGRLLDREEAEVVLLMAVEPRLERDDQRQARLDQGGRYLERIARFLRGDEARTRTLVRLGDPAGVILGVVEELRPDLVVMATHGRGGARRWLRGSVAERVLRNCSVPLLLANPQGFASEDPGFPNILVPLDGSGRSAAILPLVEAFARLYESKVVLLHVGVDPHVPAVAPADAFLPTEEELRRRLEPHRQRLASAGLQVEVRTRIGLEAEEILEAAEGASLLMMTTHGRSGLDRWLFGSVAEKVVRQARCPLLVQRVAAFGRHSFEAAETQTGPPSSPGGSHPVGSSNVEEP